MSRHPYTYAADFIRGLAGYNSDGTKLSRSDASTIRQGIADVLGMKDEELAIKLSERYQANLLKAGGSSTEAKALIETVIEAVSPGRGHTL